MTTRILVAALALMFVPAIASADRYRDGGSRYRYDTRHDNRGHGGGHSSWGVSVGGYSGGAYYGGYYNRGYRPYGYCPPPVVVRPAPVYVAPPPVYYPPAPCYTPAPYYAPTYYGPSYYGSSGISFGFSYYGR